MASGVAKLPARSRWRRRILQAAGVVLLLLVVSVTGAAIFVRHHINEALAPTPLHVSKTLMAYADESPQRPRLPAPAAPAPFDWQMIDKPRAATAPWVRWWWPGADVDAAELRRELLQLREGGFGGVEVQPFAFGVTPVTSKDPAAKARVYGVDTPRYFGLVRGMMQDAGRLGMGVDLTSYSGWPAGSPVVTPEDGTQSLAWSEVRFTGGGPVSIAIPRPRPGLNAYFNVFLGFLGFGDTADFDVGAAKLVSVMIARPAGGGHGFLSLRSSQHLDPQSVQVVDEDVRDGKLSWNAPPGDWIMIASWLLPTGEQVTLAAMKPPTYIVDALNARAMQAHYNYIFGARSGLNLYYGRPFRALFNDSLEFKADRLSSRDFLAEFRRRRGYDLRPYLAAIYQRGIDDFYVGEMLPPIAPSFTLSAEDARIRYDYQLTLSDLLIERFVATSQSWAAARGLQSRGQTYGIDLDVIRGLGANGIPETEQLYAGGSQAFLRLASSAALLYGRPLVSSESFVWQDQDYASNGAKLKLAADSLFLAGVNHIIYHGYPYDWRRGDRSRWFANVGWDPWSSPERTRFDFSGNYSERTPLWNDIRTLNSYITRAQNLLRQGHPRADVLIYYPFLGFRNSGYGPEAAREPLSAGAFPLADPSGWAAARAGASKTSANEQVVWLHKVRPLLDALDARGVTWSWVNGEGLRDQLLPGGRTRGGGSYGGIVLADAQAIAPDDLAAAQKLAAAGTPVFVHGAPPARQPGFLDWRKGDMRVQAIARDLARRRADVRDPASLADAIAAAVRPHISYPAAAAIGHFERVLDDHGSIDFLTNRSARKQEIGLHFEGQGWWFDAMTGDVAPVVRQGDGSVRLMLAPYESRFLVTGVPRPAFTRSPRSLAMAAIGQWPLDGWQVTLGTERRSGLFDWNGDTQFRYAADSAVYHTSIALPVVAPGMRFLLEVPPQPGTAFARVNGRFAGWLSVPPGRSDITDLVRDGANSVDIVYRQPMRNSLIGALLAGDKRLRQFKGREGALVPAGLRGPIRIIAER